MMLIILSNHLLKIVFTDKKKFIVKSEEVTRSIFIYFLLNIILYNLAINRSQMYTFFIQKWECIFNEIIVSVM